MVNLHRPTQAVAAEPVLARAGRRLPHVAPRHVAEADAARQGLTLVHCPAQPQPFLTQKHTL